MRLTVAALLALFLGAYSLPAQVKANTNQYVYHGCNVYSPSDQFNTDISGASVDGNSATIIGQLLSGTFDTDDQDDEQVNLGTSATTTYAVGSVSGGHTPPMYPQASPPPAPWVGGWFIEPLSDGHAVSLLTDSCVDYETYHTTWNPPPSAGARLTAFDGQENNLGASWASQMVPGNDAMTQSGIPFLGTVDYGEDASLTAINHVLAMMGEAGTGVSSWGYVYPATNPAFVEDTGCPGSGFGLSGNSCEHPLHEGGYSPPAVHL